MKKKENTLSSKNKSKMQEKYTEHVNDHKSKKVRKQNLDHAIDQEKTRSKDQLG